MFPLKNYIFVMKKVGRCQYRIKKITRIYFLRSFFFLLLLSISSNLNYTVKKIEGVKNKELMTIY
jgi:hypothetical protein